MKTDAAINHILSEEFSWPRDLETMTEYRRLHDDHDGTECGEISMVVAPDGDVHIATVGLKPCESLRFRTCVGGGNSPMVRNALIVLAEAIRREDLDRLKDSRPLDSVTLKLEEQDDKH